MSRSAATDHLYFVTLTVTDWVDILPAEYIVIW
jgi:hypothetical protein